MHHTATARQPFCSHWLTSQAGDQSNCLKQDDLVVTENPHTVVLIVDPHLVEDTIFTLPIMLHLTQSLSQTLDGRTAHQLVTVMAAPSPNRSWQEVINLNLMKSKCFMILLKNQQTETILNSLWIIGRMKVLNRSLCSNVVSSHVRSKQFYRGLT